MTANAFAEDIKQSLAALRRVMDSCLNP